MKRDYCNTSHKKKKRYLAAMSPGLEAGSESSSDREVGSGERVFEGELQGFGIRGGGEIEIGPTAEGRAEGSGIGRGWESLELVVVGEELVGLEGESGGKEEEESEEGEERGLHAWLLVKEGERTEMYCGKGRSRPDLRQTTFLRHHVDPT